MPERESFTPPEIARRYGVDPAKVLTWIHAGELVGINIATNANGSPRFIVTAEALAAFEAKRSTGTLIRAATPARKRKPLTAKEYV